MSINSVDLWIYIRQVYKITHKPSVELPGVVHRSN